MLLFVYFRGAVPVGGPQEANLIQETPRGVVAEESALGGWQAQNPNVQSRSFKMLQQQLGTN